MADFEFIYGVMGSGKSLNIVNEAYEQNKINRKPLVLKPAIDSKGEKQIVTRAGAKLDVDILIEPDLDLEEIVLRHLGKNSMLLIDELQFIRREQVDQISRLAHIHNVRSLTTGLRLDFDEQPFPGSQRAIEVADIVREQTTYCIIDGCGEKARRNTRTVDGTVVFTGPQVVIDDKAEVDYPSVCVEHYYQIKAEALAT